jgi:hypothetical protein
LRQTAPLGFLCRENTKARNGEEGDLVTGNGRFRAFVLSGFRGEKGVRPGVGRGFVCCDRRYERLGVNLRAGQRPIMSLMFGREMSLDAARNAANEPGCCKKRGNCRDSVGIGPERCRSACPGAVREALPARLPGRAAVRSSRCGGRGWCESVEQSTGRSRAGDRPAGRVPASTPARRYSSAGVAGGAAGRTVQRVSLEAVLAVRRSACTVSSGPAEGGAPSGSSLRSSWSMYWPSSSRTSSGKSGLARWISRAV